MDNSFAKRIQSRFHRVLGVETTIAAVITLAASLIHPVIAILSSMVLVWQALFLNGKLGTFITGADSGHVRGSTQFVFATFAFALGALSSGISLLANPGPMPKESTTITAGILSLSFSAVALGVVIYGYFKARKEIAENFGGVQPLTGTQDFNAVLKPGNVNTERSDISNTGVHHAAPVVGASGSSAADEDDDAKGRCDNSIEMRS